MPRIPMPFGQGLDRETGVMAVRPGSIENVKNLILFEGKATVRKGFALVDSYEDDEGAPLTHILEIVALRTEQTTIVAGYNAATGKVFIYRASNQGKNPEILPFSASQTHWFQLPAASPAPRIIGTDTYGKVVLAHDEPLITRRAPTVYHDPLEANPVTVLEAALDGSGLAPVKFRGVVRHLNYLFGWGFGTKTFPDRPEIVRVSLPGEPLSFSAEHYFLAGQRGEPVLRCGPIGKTLAVLKEADSYEIFGYDRQTFGIRPLDPLRGVASPRLALFISGQLFAWGVTPWTHDGSSGPQELSVPLDLDGPDPVDLVAQGATADGFVAYLPKRQCVLFIFGRRVYCLSIRGEPWKWSYWELGFTPTAAGLLFVSSSNIVASTPPIGYPEALPPEQWGANAIGPTTAIAKVKHHGTIGAELLETFVRPAAGAWTKLPTVEVKNAGIEGATQNVPISGLVAATTYDLAFRYRRNGKYAAGYDDPAHPNDPDFWTAATAPQSKTSFTTAAPAARTLNLALWSRQDAMTEQLALTWAGSDLFDTEIYYRTLAGAWTLIDTVAAGETTYDWVLPGDESLSEQWLDLKVTPVGGADSNFKRVWTGPQQPLGDSDGDGTYAVGDGPSVAVDNIWINDPYDQGRPQVDPDNVSIGVAWANADGSWATEVWRAEDGAAAILVATVAAGGRAFQDTPIARRHTEAYKLRHKSTVGGKDDFSDFTATTVVQT